MTELDLCMGCMSKLDENGSCPNCGHFDADTYTGAYLKPGTKLAGHYVVGKLMSCCGESALYIGYDLLADRKVTVREYMPDTLCVREKGDTAVMVRSDKLPLYKTYLAEFIELHSTLMHSPGISCVQTVLDVFTENGTAYAVMDYIGGITLRAYLDNCGGAMSWERVKELFPPALTALSQLHEMGIIHRGISTSTIVISEKNELRLIGFSISAARTADSEIGYEVFSGYAPPEQYSSTRRNGSWTDVFGISAVLYRCLTGVTPPSAVERLADDTLTDPMLINRNIPKNVSNVIMKGMSLEAEDRISTVTELVDRLFEQPKPSDISNEITLPMEKQSAPPAQKKTSSSNHSGSHSKSAKKKSKKSKAEKDRIKFIVGASILGVIILIFILAIIIPASNEEEPEITTQTTPHIVTSAPATTAASVSEDESLSSDDTQQSNVADGYIIPDFAGSFFSTVSTSPQYSYLIFNATYDFSTQYPSGQIISQDIAPHTSVFSGTEINVVVSKGPEKVPLPQYSGMTAEEYAAELSELGIKYRTEQEESSDIDEGKVIRCSKEAGEEVDVANSEEIVVYVAVKPAETTEETTEDTAEASSDSSDTPQEETAPQESEQP